MDEKLNKYEEKPKQLYIYEPVSKEVLQLREDGYYYNMSDTKSYLLDQTDNPVLFAVRQGEQVFLKNSDGTFVGQAGDESYILGTDGKMHSVNQEFPNAVEFSPINETIALNNSPEDYSLGLDRIATYKPLEQSESIFGPTVQMTGDFEEQSELEKGKVKTLGVNPQVRNKAGFADTLMITLIVGFFLGFFAYTVFSMLK